MKELFTIKKIIRHIIVLIGILFLISLGLWQLDRLEERRAYNQAVKEGLNQPITMLTGDEDNLPSFHFRRVAVVGTFDNERDIIIQNRPFHGQPGVRLVTPLQLENSDQVVLVDRGWIPQNDAEQAIRSKYDRTGKVTIEGIAYRTQPRPEGMLVAVESPPREGNWIDAWFRMDIENIQKQLPYPLLPIFIRESPTSELIPDETPPLREGIGELDEGSHLNYAMQWFTFSLMLAIIYGIINWQELKKKEEST